MPILVRTRSSGRSFELRITHRLLPKPAFFTFSTEQEAREYGRRAEESMGRGIVPEGLLPAPEFAFTDIAGAIRAYENAKSVPRSTSNVLSTVSRDIGPTPISKVDYAWSEAWVRAQKIDHHRSPGTIRHHVGALSRCLHWVAMVHPTYLPINPLRNLERGYASYDERERKVVAAKGWEPKEDIERERRLEPDEEVEIVRILKDRIASEIDQTMKT